MIHRIYKITIRRLYDWLESRKREIARDYDVAEIKYLSDVDKGEFQMCEEARVEMRTLFAGLIDFDEE